MSTYIPWLKIPRDISDFNAFFCIRLIMSVGLLGDCEGVALTASSSTSSLTLSITVVDGLGEGIEIT